MVLDELITLLVANNFGTAGTDIFKGGLPPLSVATKALGLQTYPGRSPDRSLGTNKITTEYPAVQILSRDLTRDAAETTLRAVVALLVTVLNTNLSGVRYLSITPQQDVFFLQYDKQGDQAPVFAVNVEGWRVPA